MSWGLGTSCGKGRNLKRALVSPVRTPDEDEARPSKTEDGQATTVGSPLACCPSWNANGSMSVNFEYQWIRRRYNHPHLKCHRTNCTKRPKRGLTCTIRTRPSPFVRTWAHSEIILCRLNTHIHIWGKGMWIRLEKLHQIVGMIWAGECHVETVEKGTGISCRNTQRGRR